MSQRFSCCCCAQVPEENAEEAEMSEDCEWRENWKVQRQLVIAENWKIAAEEKQKEECVIWKEKLFDSLENENTSSEVRALTADGVKHMNESCKWKEEQKRAEQEIKRLRSELRSELNNFGSSSADSASEV